MARRRRSFFQAERSLAVTLGETGGQLRSEAEKIPPAIAGRLRTERPNFRISTKR